MVRAPMAHTHTGHVSRARPRSLVPTLVAAAALLHLAAGAEGACSVQSSGAGGPVVMENGLVKVVVDPSRGGTVSSFVLKSVAADLTATWRDQPVGQGFGLFIDRVTTAQRQRVRDYETSPYASQVVADGRNEAAVRVAGTSPSGVGREICFAKTYRLRAGSAELTVDYEVANIGQRPIIASIWTTHMVRAANAAEPLVYYYPTPTGARQERYARLTKAVNVFVNDAQAGWCAAMGERNGLGLAFSMDYPTLKVLYSFLPGRTADQDFPTLEWWTQNLVLEPVKALEGEAWSGKPWRTRVSVMPLTGLPRIDGYAKGLAAAIEAKDGRAKLSLLSATDRAVAVELSSGPATGRRASAQVETWRLAAGRPTTKTFSNVPAKAGAIVRAQLRAGRELLLSFERPFGPPEALAGYTIKPAEEKLPEAKADASARLTRAFVTPHVKWATPSKHRPLKTLFLVRSSMQRDIIELAQRMDLDFTVVPTQYSHYRSSASNAGLMFYYPGLDPVEEFQSALAKQKWDAVCICSRFWKLVPEKTRKLIVARVHEGTALINVNPRSLTPDVRAILDGPLSAEGAATIRANVPFALLPVLDADPTGERWVKPIELGKGRAVFLTYPTTAAHNYRGDMTALTPAIQSEPLPQWPAHEYYYSLVARAFLWAAHRLPDRAMALDASRVRPVGLGDTAEIRVLSSSPGADTALFTAHTRSGIKLASGTVPLGADRAAWIRLPRMRRSGAVLVDVRLLDDGMVVDWGTATFRVGSPMRSLSVSVPDAAYEPGTTLHVTLEAQADEPVRETTVRLAVSDMHDRLVWQADRGVGISQGANRWQMPIRFDCPLTIRHRVRATVSAAIGELAAAEGVLYAKTKAVPNFDFLVWGAGWVSHMSSPARQQLKKIGVTIYEINAPVYRKHRVTNEWLRNRCDEILRDDMAVALQNVNWMGGYAAKDNPCARLYCLDDPAYTQGVVAALRRELRGLGKMGVKVCSTGDEISIGRYASFNDMCQSKHTVAAFRRWLAKRYGSIAALNREWATKYASFDEVPGIRWADVENMPNKAPWAEFRTFMETRMESYLRTFGAECRALLPGARVGFDGNSTLCSYNGFDWWRISGVTDMVTLYRTAAAEHYLGCFHRARGTKPHFSMWLSAPVGKALAYRPWEMLFEGMTSADYWYEPLLLNPDHTINEYGQRLGEQVTEIQRGLGTILLSAERQYDPVAILYSQASVHAATIEAPAGRPGPVELNADHFAWTHLMRDAGLTPEFISYEQLADGYLSLATHRALVLPLCYALSAAEIEQIKRFVAAGGLLIVDSSPGLYNERGRRLGRRQIDELLGVERRGDERACVPGVDVAVPGSDKPFALPWPVADRDLRLTTGAAWGRANSKAGTRATLFGGMQIRSRVAGATTIPAVIVAQRGRGRSCYLNLPVWRYKEIRGTGRGQQLVALLSALLGRAGIKPPLPVCDGGSPVPELTTSRWVWGKGLYVGLIRALNGRAGPGQGTIAWDRPGVAYDVRAKQLVSRETETAFSLSEQHPLLLARLPYAVSGVSAAGPDEVRRSSAARVVLDVNASSGRATHHVLRCTVVDPSGKVRDGYTRNVVAANGRGAFHFTPALNDPQGMWRVEAQDVVSGVRAAVEIRVRK